MSKIPTLYSNYEECMLDLKIYGKIVATPQQSIEEMKETLFEEFKRRKPLPTLEYKRYELSRLISSDYRIIYNRELELQDNESLVDLENTTSSLEKIDFSELTPLIDSMQELFSYENQVDDALRNDILSKYDLETGEMFKPGIQQVENIVGSVEVDESTILEDEKINQLGVVSEGDFIEPYEEEIMDSDVKKEKEETTYTFCDDDDDESLSWGSPYAGDSLSFLDHSEKELEPATQQVNAFELDDDEEIEESDDELEDFSEDDSDDYDAYSDDDDEEIEESDDELEDFSEDDSDDYDAYPDDDLEDFSEDDSDDYGNFDESSNAEKVREYSDNTSDSNISEDSEDFDEDDEDFDEYDEVDDEFDEYDDDSGDFDEDVEGSSNIAEVVSGTSADDDAYDEDDDFDEYSDDDSGDFDEDVDFDEYSDDDEELDDYDEDESDGTILESVNVAEEPPIKVEEKQTSGVVTSSFDLDDDDLDFLDEELDGVVTGEPLKVEPSKPIITETVKTPIISEPKKQEPIVDRSAEPTDLRAFIRKHPNCDYNFALQYFTKKQINDAIKLGRIIKKGNNLKI